ncbi:possible tyrosine transporter P-protein (TC 2.A.45.2.1) [Alkalithermobacter thermoalcaliphilus JW-YL-7 = DSM 7308]|uniref:Citrate transporter n=1 Tax=Alkalithermobacter thermoalcaliphilus JW-YL-7 = DSM 7308 TaxID=1121328 RepID=A0A150FRY0_CLOPD|nr:Citrate transporter [[Clostridium] paradoxum JW-YL-7 = DSM 7308]SHK36135.1 possible tyrosine transporter P-protein (TC 2.A.45.2.1) [[Clostridium] paradoxum JW-YL-7 = DSM 7308]
MFSQSFIAVFIFILTYVFIVSEKIDRTAISFFGACLMILFGIVTQEEAIHYIDFNTIGLLIGMMIVVSILKSTGLFQYIAIKSAKIAKGEPLRIIVIFSIVTAVLSAFLDNVTTVLLIAPVTLVITDTLKVNPIPFLVPQILSSNIGGTATLVGDPPNIMIGSSTNLSFLDFIFNTGPISLIILIVTIFSFKFIYKDKLHVTDDVKQKVFSFDEKLAIKDKKLLVKSLTILLLTVLGFLTHERFGLESSSVALIGASIMLLVSRSKVEEVFHDIEWPTIFFFVFLFILVGGLEKVGIIDKLAYFITSSTKNNLFLSTILILWTSAIASAFLDNIPFVATMIPLIKKIALLSSTDITPLWWALSLGACLGGNGSLIGASANVIVAGMLKKHNNEISFIDYLKIGFPLMIVSIILSTIYLILFYL